MGRKEAGGIEEDDHLVHGIKKGISDGPNCKEGLFFKTNSSLFFLGRGSSTVSHVKFRSDTKTVHSLPPPPGVEKFQFYFQNYINGNRKQ